MSLTTKESHFYKDSITKINYNSPSSFIQQWGNKVFMTSPTGCPAYYRCNGTHWAVTAQLGKQQSHPFALLESTHISLFMLGRQHYQTAPNFQGCVCQPYQTQLFPAKSLTHAPTQKVISHQLKVATKESATWVLQTFQSSLKPFRYDTMRSATSWEWWS